MKGGDIIQEANYFNTYSKTNRKKNKHHQKDPAGLCFV